jgi:hypothetical protein
MNDDDFEKLCKSLEQAIAYASGEEVEGVIIHQPKKAHVVRKETHVKKPGKVGNVVLPTFLTTTYG